ncbi:MAG: FAD-binding oxidoreductase, partial [Dehalococcoidia bacterium]
MATTASLRTSLSGILSTDSLAPDAELERYAVEGLVPKAAAFPTSQEQVAAVLGLAGEERLTVVPRGSGSLMALGSVPERLDIVLGMDRLFSPIEHAPGDMTVTVGAGSTLESLQETLEKEGQWLPLDPPLAPQRTVGGILATGLTGPLSLAYGTTRDMVLGMKVAGTDGIITKSGGKVVKNVTGFDVTKAHL